MHNVVARSSCVLRQRSLQASAPYALPFVHNRQRCRPWHSHARSPFDLRNFLQAHAVSEALLARTLLPSHARGRTKSTSATPSETTRTPSDPVRLQSGTPSPAEVHPQSLGTAAGVARQHRHRHSRVVQIWPMCVLFLNFVVLQDNRNPRRVRRHICRNSRTGAAYPNSASNASVTRRSHGATATAALTPPHEAFGGAHHELADLRRRFGPLVLLHYWLLDLGRRTLRSLFLVFLRRSAVIFSYSFISCGLTMISRGSCGLRNLLSLPVFASELRHRRFRFSFRVCGQPLALHQLPGRLRLIHGTTRRWRNSRRGPQSTI